jgi:hypothetical protein
MNEPHDHDLDIVLVCRTCGRVMREVDGHVEQRLIRFVAPPMTATSDNLTSAAECSVTFDVHEVRHQSW